MINILNRFKNFDFKESKVPLIVFEGCNCSGKTTICKILCDFFNSDYNRGVPKSFLNNALLVDIQASKSYYSSIYYYISGMILQSETLIKRKSKFIFIDRWFLSTLAFHYSFGDKQRFNAAFNAIECVQRMLIKPTITICLTIPFTEIVNRTKNKCYKDSKSDKIMLHEHMYERENFFYSHMMNISNNDFYILENYDSSINETIDQCVNIINKFI